MSRKRPPHFAVYSSSTDVENGVPPFARCYTRHGLARFLVSKPGPWTIRAHEGGEVRFGKGPKTWILDYSRISVPGQAIFSVRFPCPDSWISQYSNFPGVVKLLDFGVEISTCVEVVS